MKKSGFYSLLLLVLSLGLLVTGCGGQKDKAAGSASGGTINISLHQDPPKLDPNLSTAFVERHVFQSIFDKLVDIDDKGNVIPMLAEKWEISPDGLHYTLHLRKDVKFHDGTAFNAEAVKFNLEAYKENTSSSKNELSVVKEIKVVDEYTVELVLSEPFAPLLAVLTDRSGMMRSPEAVKKYGEEFMNHPVGTGPYMFEARTKGDSITLVKNPNYWQKGFPKADKIVYKTISDANVALVNLKSGQIDFTNRFPLNEVNNYANDAKIAVLSEPSPGFKGMALNTSNEKFSDVRVRQAIEKAIDRDAIVKVALSGVGTAGSTGIPSNNFAYNEELDKPHAPDIAKAKELLQAAGKEGGFSFTVITDTDPNSQKVMQLVQKMLKEINIDMSIEKQDFGTLLDRATKGNFEAAMVGWSGRVDPDQNLYDWVYTKARMNYMRYSNPKLDELLNNGRTVTDVEKRKAIYKDIMSIVLEDSPYIYLFHERDIFGISKNISNFKPAADSMIRTVTLEKKN